MGKEVREPIQVYLSDSERSELDRLAKRLGVSRSEVLRRGVSSLSSTSPAPVDAGPLSGLVEDGLLTPAQASHLPLPRTKPVAPLAEILEEISQDRADR
jgi:Ribbon-helix-helix protein, copG family